MPGHVSSAPACGGALHTSRTLVRRIAAVARGLGDEGVQLRGDACACVLLQVVAGADDPHVALAGGALDVPLEVLIDGPEPQGGLLLAEGGPEGLVEVGRPLPGGAVGSGAESAESAWVGISCGMARGPALYRSVGKGASYAATSCRDSVLWLASACASRPTGKARASRTARCAATGPAGRRCGRPCRRACRSGRTRSGRGRSTVAGRDEHGDHLPVQVAP